ncbi:MAG: Ig-like domain-containing protein [Bacteroidales bacterium]|nr:Ig-like domain-containing protein [Bacteroidales bacterium]
MKKIVFALVAAASLLVACQPKPVLVSAIKLSQTTGSVVEGETLHISAIVSPSEADNKELNWTSNAPAVATVDPSGTVTGVTPGTAKITAAATDGSGVTATCEITVAQKAILVTAIDLNESAKTLKAGETLQLTAVVSPADATVQTVNWASDKTDVATVDATGKVTAVKSGTANITAAATDESGVTSAACVVTVVEPKPMFAKFSDMLIRVGQEYSNTVYYGTVDNYAEREDVEGAVWASENEGIATVTSGVIKGIAPGKTNVTVTDAIGSKLTIPVEVLAAANKDYDYNYGVEVIDCRDASLAWNKSTSAFSLKDGYVSGTQCMGATINGYKVAEVYFTKKVDASSVQHPALYLRVYIDDVSKLTTDSDGADQPYIEIRSTGEVWVPGTTAFPYVEDPKTLWRMTDIFTNWQNHTDKAKQTLVNGWNNIVLPVESAARQDCDLKAITYFRFFQLPGKTYQPVEFRFDQIRIVDWTEFDSCDNFDQWFDGGTANNRPCYRAAENKDGHDKVFGSENELIVGPISNFRLKEWAGRVYSMPADMDETNSNFTWWFWVDDADFFNKCWITVELSSNNVNDKDNFKWTIDPGKGGLKNGWNQLTHDFASAHLDAGERTVRNINYFRLVITPEASQGAKAGFHTYYIDDLRIVKK